MKFSYYQPLILLFSIIGLIGLIRVRRQRGAILCAIGLLGLFAISWPPVDWLLSRPLEAPYRMHPVDLKSVGAIVVLSSSIQPPLETRPYAIPNQDTYERCDYAAFLYRQEPRQVLTCGGGGEYGVPAYSVVMRDFLVKLGVPQDSIWTEERSSSTYENALYGAQILRKYGIRKVALVVDQRSMLRAEACFRKQGIEVVPAPAFHTQMEFGDEWMPRGSVITRLELTLHESVGMLWYRLRGWI
jgi:uncharacterized SAM-binding protein YcdF (DUF218 family)